MLFCQEVFRGDGSSVMPFHQGLCELLMVPPGQDMRMGKEGTGVSGIRGDLWMAFAAMLKLPPGPSHFCNFVFFQQGLP